MKDRDNHEDAFQMAREAIDQEDLYELLQSASDGEVEEDAVRALQEVAAEEVVTVALDASSRSRRRVRATQAEDVAEAAEERRGCCGIPPVTKPLFAVREGD